MAQKITFNELIKSDIFILTVVKDEIKYVENTLLINGIDYLTVNLKLDRFNLDYIQNVFKLTKVPIIVDYNYRINNVKWFKEVNKKNIIFDSQRVFANGKMRNLIIKNILGMQYYELG